AGIASAWRRTKGQVDPDLGAPARLARDRNRAVKALHDVLRNGKTKPGAAALGGEIRIEHARQIRWVDPHATIRNDNRRAIVVRRSSQRDRRFCGWGTIRSALGYGGAGVDEQVAEGISEGFS